MKVSLGLRINLLIIFLLLSLIAISPRFGEEGIEITGVSEKARGEGFSKGEIIKEINNVKISNPNDYSEAIASYLELKPVNITIIARKLSLNERNETLEESVRVEYEALDSLMFDLENLTIKNSKIDKIEDGMLLEEINNVKIKDASDFEEIRYKLLPVKKIEILTDKNRHIFLLAGDPGIDIKEISKNKIKKGLELEGGTRVLLRPKEKVTDKELQDLISVLRNKLDVYGLSDLRMRGASSGDDKFILIEIAGVSRGDIEDFIAKQGKFEAKIGNITVFEGGKKDIPFVCKDDGTCSGVRDCRQVENGYSCRFEFQITLSPEAAKRHAEVTKDLDIVGGVGVNSYLSKQIDFFLDGKLVDSLNIASSLKGVEATQIQISGPGIGSSKEAALNSAIVDMEKLQTVLITGSLPTELEIAEINSVSPILGKEFVKNTLKVALFAIIAVLVVIFVRYRNFKIIIGIAITLVSEILIVLGIAAFLGWRFDLASIAGIIASVGTGVDDQIVITDEILRGKKEEIYFNWKEKIKKAFFIITVAYFTVVVAMLPLWSAGAGLFRGFALTSIIGVSVGVFVTRPAFASMIEKLMK